jgi:putative phosphonate metabolism protein
MTATMRAGIYWAPEHADPLHALGSAWLGRDAETGAPVRQPPVPGLAEITADPRGYGLHATLKPPFRLARPWAELCREVEALAASIRVFALPPLSVQNLKGFLALRESAPCPPLYALADRCVEALDSFRAPPSEDELARRRRAKLSERHEANLVRWGYPYVFEDFQFHVTLTQRLDDAAREALLPALLAHFGDVPAMPRLVRELCLFTQAGPGAPFLIAERFPLKGA